MLIHTEKAEIIIGRLPETNDGIVWDCVEELLDEGDSLRLLSREGLAVIPFENLLEGQNANKLKNCYYQNSDLQKWLNGEFLELYFNPEERVKIKAVTIPTIEEILKWFPEKISRVCTPSYYARENGADVYHSYNDAEACVYWLADTGRKAGMSATVVMANGQIYKSAYLAATNVCVRPVIEVFREEQ